MSLEIRDLDADKMQQVFDLIDAEAERIADAHSTPINFDEIDVASAPAPTDKRMRDIIANVAEELGRERLRGTPRSPRNSGSATYECRQGRGTMRRTWPRSHRQA